MLTGEVEPAMPPEDNERPTEAEIDVLRAWIDAGAAGPEGAERRCRVLKTPTIAPAAGSDAVSHQPRPVARWQAAGAGRLSAG